MPETYEKLASLILLGLFSGLVVIGAGFCWSRLSQRHGWSVPAIGSLIALSFLICEVVIRRVPMRALIAMLLLAGTGLIPDVEKKIGRGLRLLLIASAGVLLASWSIFDEPLWLLRGLLVLGIVCLSSAFAGFDKRHATTNQTQLLLLMTVGGVLTIVPDTEEAALFLGILLAATLLARPLRLAALEQTEMIAGLFVWMICVGGQGRPASVVASVGCLGLLLAEPLVRLVTKNWLNATNRGISISGELMIHCVSIAIVLRLARTTSDIEQAAVAVAAALGFAVVALIALQVLKNRLQKRQSASEICPPPQ